MCNKHHVVEYLRNYHVQFSVIWLPAHMQYNSNIVCAERDSLILACANSGTSIYAGFTVFSVLGFMAKQQNVPVGDVAESGTDLSTSKVKNVSWSLFFFVLRVTSVRFRHPFRLLHYVNHVQDTARGPGPARDPILSGPRDVPK